MSPRAGLEHAYHLLGYEHGFTHQAVDRVETSSSSATWQDIPT